MDIRDVQRELRELGLYKGEIDGDFGPLTDDAIDGLVLAERATIDARWSDARRLVAAEQLIARRRGIDVGTIDGLVGTMTRHAFEVYDARKANGWQKVAEVEAWRDTIEAAIAAGTVKPAAPSRPLPITAAPATAIRVPDWPRQSRCMEYFGNVGTSQVSLTLPYAMRLAWDTGKIVRKWSCHSKTREHFERIFARTLEHYGLDEIKRLRLDLWGGTLNVRKMRGGDSWSMHSWGIACDVDPEHNQLKWKRAQASLDDPPYDQFWRHVYDEGAIGLGRERDYDWMHFQFAKL